MLFVRRPLADRPLSDQERKIVVRALERCRVASPEVCLQAVERTILVPRELRAHEVRGPRSLIAHVALAARADGIALGRYVYLRADLLGPDGRAPIDLVAHEVTHVAQFLRDGTMPFCFTYASAYLRGRARGLDDHQAYLAIPHEVEARAVAASIDATIVRVLRR